MTDDEQYAATLESCEVTARNNGHLLGGWHVISKHLHAASCVVCGAMVWIVRPSYEKRWRVGGSVLNQDCPLTTT